MRAQIRQEIGAFTMSPASTAHLERSDSAVGTQAPTPPLSALLEALSGLHSGADWRAEAACRGIDSFVFYPTNEEEAQAAKAICFTCPVRKPCLEHALARREKDGVWGGATEKERRRIIRQRRRAA